MNVLIQRQEGGKLIYGVQFTLTNDLTTVENEIIAVLK